MVVFSWILEILFVVLSYISVILVIFFLGDLILSLGPKILSGSINFFLIIFFDIFFIFEFFIFFVVLTVWKLLTSLKQDLCFFEFVILLDIFLVIFFDIFCSFEDLFEEFLLWKLWLGLIEESTLLFELLLDELFEFKEYGESFLNKLFL